MGAHRLLRLSGLGAVAFYAVHGVYHWFYGFPENLFWTCHVGSLAVGLGLLLGSAMINGVGVLFLALGTPLWLVGLCMGGKFVPTSLLTHIGGVAIGLWGAARLGVPRRLWWKALAGLLLLHVMSRWWTPLDKNVNFARGIWKGFEDYFPSYAVFFVCVLGASTAYFAAVERVLRRAFGPERE